MYYRHSASYHDLHLEHNTNGILIVDLYDQRDVFKFAIVTFPFLNYNIPFSAFGIYMSQLILKSLFSPSGLFIIYIDMFF